MSTPINDGGPAFPIQATPHDRVVTPAPHPGMTLRDYFAAQALAGLLSQSPSPAFSSWHSALEYGFREEQRNDDKKHADTMACWAYDFADAMLAARERKSE